MPRYSLLFVLPLLILYEVLALALAGPDRSGVRNAADVMLRQLATLLGGTHGPAVLGAAVVIGCLVLVRRDLKRGGGVRPGIFTMMLAESCVHAVLLGVVVGTLTVQILGPLARLSVGDIAAMGVPTQIMLSLGAGLYEELVFRVLLVGALTWAARIILGVPVKAAVIFAVIGSALLFSAFHYIGPYGDELRLGSFVFRTLAGVVFSVLYVLRGFGITAWAHALYDLFLLLL